MIAMVAHFWWATWPNCSWSLIFGERPEWFAHIAHFWWVTWAIHSNRSLKKREWANFSSKKCTKNVPKNTILVNFFWANHSFFVSKQEICSITHLSWVTWANHSRLLICHDRPERFAHGDSFDMSHLSDSLTVAHLSWVIRANRSQSLIGFERSERMSDERLSDERLSKFPTLCLPYLTQRGICEGMQGEGEPKIKKILSHHLFKIYGLIHWNTV